MFFLSAGIYTFSIANLMYEYKKAFPFEDEGSINFNYRLSYFMLTMITLLSLSTIFFGPKYWVTPALEWATVFLHMNYFSIINFTNPFYDSIHPF